MCTWPFKQVGFFPDEPSRHVPVAGRPARLQPTPSIGNVDRVQANLALQREFQELLFKGSKSVLQEDSSAALTALTAYEKAREFAQHHDSKILQHDETDSVILRYCTGLAQVNSGVKANINSAIATFREIGECEGKNYLFAFFGLGVAYRKFNYFEMAIPWLERGLRAINNGVQITGRRSSWPGLSHPSNIHKFSGNRILWPKKY